MNKFKKIMLGALSILTLGLFVATGAKINAASAITEKFTATVTDFTGVAVGASKKVTLSGDKGNSLDVTFNNIASKSATESGSNRCYVKYNNSSDSCSFTFTNTKGSIKLTLGFRTGGSSHKWNGTFDSGNAVELKGTTTQDFNSSAVGAHTLLLANAGSTKDFQIESFIIEETSESTETLHQVYYHDINGNVISSLTQDVAENTNTTEPRAAENAPTVIGKTFTKWTIGQNGSDVGATIDMGTEDIDLYSVYTSNEGYTVSNANLLDQTMLQYAKENFGTNNLSKDMIFGDSIFEVGKNNKFQYSETVTKIADKEFNYGIHTGGSISADSNGFIINAPSAGYIVAYVKSGSTSSARTISLYPANSATASVVGKELPGTSPAASDKMVFNVTEAGTYRIGSNGGVYVYSLEFKTTVKSADYASATTAAFQNTDKDSLRFVGTISGVSDLSTIDTIELVLLKNDEPTKKQIFLTTCFISVSGAGSFEETDDTYYVVYRITGIDSTSMPDNTVIKHKLIVTFTDGSSVTSLVESSKWTN